MSLVALAALFAPLVPWWIRRAGDDDAFAGLAIGALTVLVGVLSLRSSSLSSSLSSSSSMASAAPLTVVVPLLAVGALGAVVGAVFDVRLVAMEGAVLLAGALGVVRMPARAGVVVALTGLVVLAQPLAGDLDVIGFPARVFAATVAKDVLRAGGVVVGGAEAVLVVEGNVADVEAPCAGIATLRMLMVVVLALVALRRASLRRGAAAVLLAAIVALLGNAARVTALAALVLVAQAPTLAHLVHVPLGVLVFVAAVVVADRLVVGNADVEGVESVESAVNVVRARRVVQTAVAVVVCCALSGALLRVSRGALLPASAAAVAVVDDEVPWLTGEALPLSPAERGLFARHATWARKQRVVVDGRDIGSALFVAATSLRAHHSPERCLAGSGLRVDSSGVGSFGGIDVKDLVLDGGARRGISFYVRDDDGHAVVLPGLLDRMADQVRHRHARWVFVSLVVEQSAVGDDGVDTLDALVPELVRVAHEHLVSSSSSSSSSSKSSSAVWEQP